MALLPIHLSHLDSITNDGLLKKFVPPEIEEHLLAGGYARKGVGGLIPTEAAYHALVKWESRG